MTVVANAASESDTAEVHYDRPIFLRASGPLDSSFGAGHENGDGGCQSWPSALQLRRSEPLDLPSEPPEEPGGARTGTGEIDLGRSISFQGDDLERRLILHSHRRSSPDLLAPVARAGMEWLILAVRLIRDDLHRWVSLSASPEIPGGDLKS